MRTFQLFVSALALANLTQATPLDFELAQLGAELDLEAELPISKDGGKKLAGWMTKLSGLIKDGAPFKSEQKTGTHWRETSSSWAGEETEYTYTEETSELDTAELKKIG